MPPGPAIRTPEVAETGVRNPEIWNRFPSETVHPSSYSMPGLCICLPPEQADLSGFADGTAAHPIAPGPLLAEVVTALAGGDGAGLAQVSEDCLFSVLSAGRRMSSWGTWLEFAAMRELAIRHPALDPHARKNRPAAPGRPVLDQQNMLGWLGPASAGRADRGEVIMPLDRVGRNYFAAC